MLKGKSLLAPPSEPAGVPAAALRRSWRRCFRDELPPLGGLEPAAEASRLSVAEEARVSSLLSQLCDQAGSLPGRIILAAGARDIVTEAAGGSTLSLRVALSRVGVSPEEDELWLGLVPSGSTRPDRVLDRHVIKSDTCGPGGADASLSIPPMRKKQLEAGASKSYEIWLVRNSGGLHKEDVALARVGPIRVSRNVTA